MTPGQPVVRDQLGTSVHLEWTPPAGGAPVQGYSVYYGQQGSEHWLEHATGVPNTSHIVEDLEPGTSYVFCVAAVNTLGTSDPGLVSHPVLIPTPSGNLWYQLIICGIN